MYVILRVAINHILCWNHLASQQTTRTQIQSFKDYLFIILNVILSVIYHTGCAPIYTSLQIFSICVPLISSLINSELPSGKILISSDLLLPSNRCNALSMVPPITVWSCAGVDTFSLIVFSSHHDCKEHLGPHLADTMVRLALFELGAGIEFDVHIHCVWGSICCLY